MELVQPEPEPAIAQPPKPQPQQEPPKEVKTAAVAVDATKLEAANAIAYLLSEEHLTQDKYLKEMVVRGEDGCNVPSFCACVK